MAESEEQGWLGNWLETAKSKAVSSFAMVKNDLSEFSSTMQRDTVQAASEVKNKINQENVTAATEKAKAGVNNIIEGLTKVLKVEDDQKGSHKKNSSQTMIYDRAQARLHTIQIDPSTYLEEPVGPKERYEMWAESFSLESHKPVISELLITKVEVRSLFTQLVPSQVSNMDFWRRYFYKLHQLQQEDIRRAELMKRADLAQEDPTWDEEDDWEDIEGPSFSPPTSPIGPHDDDIPTAKKSSQMPREQSRVPPIGSTVSALLPTSDASASTGLPVPPATASSSSAHTPSPALAAPDSSASSSLAGLAAATVAPTVLPAAPAAPSPAAGNPHEFSKAENSTHTTIPDKNQIPREPAAVNDSSPVSQNPGDQPLPHTANKEHFGKVKKPEVPVVKSENKDSDTEKTAPTDTTTPTRVDSGKPEVVPTVAQVRPQEVMAIVSSTTPLDINTQAVAQLAATTCTSDEEMAEFKVKDKGELVVVGSGCSSNSTSPSVASSGKEAEIDDWEKDFDLQVTDDDVKVAQDSINKITTDINTAITTGQDSNEDDDWEEWD